MELPAEHLRARHDSLGGFIHSHGQVESPQEPAELLAGNCGGICRGDVTVSDRDLGPVLRKPECSSQVGLEHHEPAVACGDG
jgi:hypothetical protein